MNQCAKMSFAQTEESNALTISNQTKLISNSKPPLSLSQQRWKILREVLVRGHSTLLASQSEASVRRFSSFGLLATRQLPRQRGELVEEGDWHEYTAKEWPALLMAVRHLPGIVKPETLLGFNNTGNVCVWPAEEVLTYHCLKNRDMFRGSIVCELGGGMTCLAGMALAVCSDMKQIMLTDGNEESVTNIDAIIQRNTDCVGDTSLLSRVLRWGSGPLDADLVERFDYIICADCLFFEDGRQSLVDTIHQLLKPEGEAILFAPLRGHTFDAFVSIAATQFKSEVCEKYDERIWELHCEMIEKGRGHYDPDIHYPLFLHLRKLPASRETSLER